MECDSLALVCTGEWMRLCLRKSRFWRYPLPIGNRPCRVRAARVRGQGFASEKAGFGAPLVHSGTDLVGVTLINQEPTLSGRSLNKSIFQRLLLSTILLWNWFALNSKKNLLREKEWRLKLLPEVYSERINQTFTSMKTICLWRCEGVWKFLISDCEQLFLHHNF